MSTAPTASHDCLSCSHIADLPEFLSGYADLYDEFGIDVAFVVGGFALTEEVRQQMKTKLAATLRILCIHRQKRIMQYHQ